MKATQEQSWTEVTQLFEAASYWPKQSAAGGRFRMSSIRVYTITELVKLLAAAGLTFRSAHRGCTQEPFRAEGPEMGGRVGLLTVR